MHMYRTERKRGRKPVKLYGVSLIADSSQMSRPEARSTQGAGYPHTMFGCNGRELFAIATILPYNYYASYYQGHQVVLYLLCVPQLMALVIVTSNLESVRLSSRVPTDLLTTIVLEAGGRGAQTCRRPCCLQLMRQRHCQRLKGVL